MDEPIEMSFEDLEEILGAGGPQVSASATPSAESLGFTGYLSGMAKEAAQGATFEFGDELYGLGASALGYDYEQAKQGYNQARDAFAKEAPWLAGLSNFGGAVGTSFIPGGQAGILGIGSRGLAKVLPSTLGKKTAQTVATALTKAPTLRTGAVTGATDAMLSAIGRDGNVAEIGSTGVLGAGMGVIGSAIAKKLTAGTAAEKKMIQKFEQEGYTPEDLGRMALLTQEAQEAGIPASILDIETLPVASSLPVKRTGIQKLATNLAQIAQGAQGQSSAIAASKKVKNLSRIAEHMSDLGENGKLTREGLSRFYDKAEAAAKNATEEALEKAQYREIYKQYPSITPSEEATKIVEERVKKAASQGKKVKVDSELVEGELLLKDLEKLNRPSVDNAIKKALADETVSGVTKEQALKSTSFWGAVRGQLSKATREMELKSAEGKGYDIEPDTLKKAIIKLDKKLDSYTEGKHKGARQSLAKTLDSDPALYGEGGLIRTIAAGKGESLRGSSPLNKVFGSQGSFAEDVDDLVRILGSKETKAAAKSTILANLPDSTRSAKASKILESENTMRQLKQLLAPEEFKKLEAKLLVEKSIEQNFGILFGGSSTAGNLSEAATREIPTSFLQLGKKAANSMVSAIIKARNTKTNRDLADLLLNPERAMSGLGTAQKLMSGEGDESASFLARQFMPSKIAQQLAQSTASTQIPRILITPRR